MARDNTRTTLAEQRWRRHIQRQQRSALNIRDYCDQNHLGEKQFHFWKRRFRQQQTNPFLTVKITPEPNTQPDADAAIEIVLDGGRRLRIEPGFDGDTLRRVLHLLEDNDPC